MRNEWYVPSPPYASPPLNSPCVRLCYLSIVVPPLYMGSAVYLCPLISFGSYAMPVTLLLEMCLDVLLHYKSWSLHHAVWCCCCWSVMWLYIYFISNSKFMFALGLTFDFFFLQIKRRKPWPQMGGKPVEVKRVRKGKVPDHRYQKCEVWLEGCLSKCPLVSALKALPDYCRALRCTVTRCSCLNLLCHSLIKHLWTVLGNTFNL